MPNIEIKARFENLGQARERAIELGGKFLWKDQQTDTYFETRAGKLKLRESELNGSELLPYIKTEVEGLKRSDYAKLSVEDPALVERLLAELLGRKSQVRKLREVYLIHNVRVHLDEVHGLGNFLEFEAVFENDTPATVEAERTKLDQLLLQFGIKRADLLDGSYPELLARATTN